MYYTSADLYNTSKRIIQTSSTGEYNPLPFVLSVSGWKGETTESMLRAQRLAAHVLQVWGCEDTSFDVCCGIEEGSFAGGVLDARKQMREPIWNNHFDWAADGS